MIVRARDRRRSARLVASSDHDVLAVRVRPGHAATLVDISASGALVDTGYRLLPGTSVELLIEATRHRGHFRARVVRCEVVHVTASALSYRGAVHFERHIPWLAAEGYVVNELAAS